MPSLSYGFSYHNYADDTQLIYSFSSHHHTAMLLTVSCHYHIRPLIMEGDTWLKAESQQKMRCCILQEMIPYSHLQLETTTKKHLITSWSWQLKIHKTCLLVSRLVSWLTRNRPVVSQLSQDMQAFRLTIYLQGGHSGACLFCHGLTSRSVFLVGVSAHTIRFL